MAFYDDDEQAIVFGISILEEQAEQGSELAREFLRSLNLNLSSSGDRVRVLDRSRRRDVGMNQPEIDGGC